MNDYQPTVFLKPPRKFVRYNSRRTMRINRPEGFINAFMTILSHSPDNNLLSLSKRGNRS